MDEVGRLARKPVYITGVAETPLGEVHDHSELSMVAVAAQEALAEAGMTLRDVDGIFVNYMGEEGSVQVGEYLGITPRYADSSDLGGAAFEAFVPKLVGGASQRLHFVEAGVGQDHQGRRQDRGLSQERK